MTALVALSIVVACMYDVHAREKTVRHSHAYVESNKHHRPFLSVQRLASDRRTTGAKEAMRTPFFCSPSHRPWSWRLGRSLSSLPVQAVLARDFLLNLLAR
jgi:hypothetical protein